MPRIFFTCYLVSFKGTLSSEVNLISSDSLIGILEIRSCPHCQCCPHWYIYLINITKRCFINSTQSKKKSLTITPLLKISSNRLVVGTELFCGLCGKVNCSGIGQCVFPLFKNEKVRRGEERLYNATLRFSTHWSNSVVKVTPFIPQDNCDINRGICPSETFYHLGEL